MNKTKYDISAQEQISNAPDPTIDTAERNAYGYINDIMLPLDKERALELYDQNCGIFLLYGDNSEAMALNREDIENHKGIYGIEHGDWEAYLADGLMLGKDSDGRKAGLTFYTAECMEFTSLGEYHHNLTLSEAARRYKSIPAERLNGVKGIGFHLADGSNYDGDFGILYGNRIDADTINDISHFHKSPLVQQAVRDLIKAFPDAQLIDRQGNYHETYRYYATRRPVDEGTYPSEMKPTDIYNFGSRVSVENGALHAWGYVEYARPLTRQQADEYGFKPSPMNKNYLAAAEMSKEQNYNMIDGLCNNEGPARADLTDGQTYDEIRELAPETLPDEKASVLEQIREARGLPHIPKELQKPKSRNKGELEL